MHQQITDEINFVNQAGIEIFDQVYNYRTELGQTLQQLLECFAVIFLKQYEVFNMTENEKDKAAELKQRDLDEQDKEVTDKQNDLASKTEMIRQLIESKDIELEALKVTNAELNEQIDQLNVMVEEEWKDKQRRKLVTDEELTQAKK